MRQSSGAGVTRHAPRRMATPIFAACGMWQVGLGLYFALLRPALLPEDVRYMGASLARVDVALPGAASWLRHVFTVMGGFMVASGVLTVFVAVTLVAERRKGTGLVMLLAGLASVMSMSWTNFAIGSGSKWLLLGPALLWGLGVVAYALEAATARP